MEISDFHKALDRFEKGVILSGVSSGKFSKKLPIPVKPCKLSKTGFGSFLGNKIDSDEVLVVDYYGYLKKSRGFYEAINEEKLMDSIVIHFASIRIEDIISITDDINLIALLPILKRVILEKRGFCK